MEIHVARNQQRQGPYSIAEVQTRLSQGSLAPTDLAWHTGLADWQPLAELEILRQPALSGTEGVPLPPPLPASGIAAPESTWMGTLALCVGLIGGGVWFVLLAAAGIMSSQGMDETNILMIIAGLAMFGMLGLNLLALVLGGIACRSQVRRRWVPITGTILNALQVVVFLGLMILGLSMR